jgi:hypothetical protein
VLAEISTSLPSSAAAKNFLEGKPGSTFALLGSTALRTALIYPGLALVGIPAKKALKGSALASVFISGFVLAYLYANQEK